VRHFPQRLLSGPSKAKGSPQATHQGFAKKSSCRQHDKQNRLSVSTVTPHIGHLGGNAKSINERKMGSDSI
tara:strand:- start:35385 stop:35597 length:213 start_codon:yes stop_codon:yes gene_type:complete